MNTPINENCARSGIPANAELPDGRKATYIPIAKTMTDFLWDRYLLAMYGYVNTLLRRGELTSITGIKAQNRWFNHETLHLSKRVNYWKIDRKAFYADVPVRLDLATPYGTKYWHGFICFWCEFGEEFDCEIIDLTHEPERDGFDVLNKFLFPVFNNRRIDYLTQQMWKDYGIPEGITDPEARNAYLLAHRMGYRIFYCRFHQREKISSVFFFGDGDMEVESDVYEVDENGKKSLVKKFDRTPFRVPAGSILVNENLIRFKYLKMKIYHECIHGQWHYCYYRLQRLTNNDPTYLQMKLIPQEEYKASDDPLYFMEKQAKRGQFGLDMPRESTLKLIEEGEKNISNFKNSGDRYEKIGNEIIHTYGEPDFFVRTRMIQLGRVQAYGAYQKADRQRIEPYGFSEAAFSDFWNWPDDDGMITYKIDECEVRRICKENEAFRELIESHEYIYVPGHVVYNDPRFVEYRNGKWRLTDLALSAIDECCIRFVQVFVQRYPGQYVYDRMYYDAEYYAQTKLYEPSSEPNKYRYKKSASGAGLVVYDHKFAYSHHATDPAYGQECNAFDLVRIHLFPDEDEKKSFQKMSEFAASQPEVGRILLEERHAAAQEDFGEDEENWSDSLERDRSGNIRNTLQNLILIMEHDPEMKKIRFNQLADNMEVDDDIAWSENRQSPFWRDADDAQLICYVDKNYGTFSARNYDIAVMKVVDDRSYHPIKLYLTTKRTGH